MIQEKLMILHQVHRRMNNGESQHSVCNSININRKLINDWNKQFPQLKDAMNNKAKSLCKGMKSCLFSFSDSLLSFIFELREQGHVNDSNEGSQDFKTISRKITGSTDILCLTFCEGARIGTLTWHP